MNIKPNPYFNPAVISGLVWGWDGSLTAAGLVRDLSPYRNDVTIEGSYIENDTIVGKTVTFNGTNTRIALGDANQYSFTNDAQGFTIVMIWQKLQTGNPEPLVSKYLAAGVTEYIVGSILTSNNHYFWGLDTVAGGYRGRLSVPVITIDGIYHLLVARKTNGTATTNFEFYSDNVKKDSGNFTSGNFTQLRNTNAPLYIGFTPYGLGTDVYANVKIGATGIYNRPLTNQELTNIYTTFAASRTRAKTVYPLKVSTGGQTLKITP